jgi:hypothetical protein
MADSTGTVSCSLQWIGCATECPRGTEKNCVLPASVESIPRYLVAEYLLLLALNDSWYTVMCHCATFAHCFSYF